MIGDRLVAERERRLGPPVSEAIATLYIAVATVRIIHVGADSAVARLDADLSRQHHPHLAYPGPIVGDRLVPAPPVTDNDIVLPSGVPFDFDRAEIRDDLAGATDTPRARFILVGHGESEPVAENTTAASRRVVIHLPGPVTD